MWILCCCVHDSRIISKCTTAQNIRYVFFLAVKKRICISTPCLQLVNVRRRICRTRPGWSLPPGQGDSSSSSSSLRSSYSVRGGKESPLFPKSTLLTKGEYQNPKYYILSYIHPMLYMNFRSLFFWFTYHLWNQNVIWSF